LRPAKAAPVTEPGILDGRYRKTSRKEPAVFIAGVVAICVVLFILALLAPRLSRKPQRAADRGLSTGARTAAKAPGPLGHWLAKPFTKSQRAADKSAATGRRAHHKIAD
jgi:Family of unknown function (DUF6411)